MVEFTVLGSEGHQGRTTIDTIVDDVWNTDFEHGLASKRDIEKVTGVEEDREAFENVEDNHDLSEWRLENQAPGRKTFSHPEIDTELEFVNREASDYLEHEFDGGVVYDGTWTTEREGVAEALANRLEAEDTALLTESSASLFEKPSEPARDPIHRLQALGLPMSENQVEMFSTEKQSTIEDIRETGAKVQSIETYRLSGVKKMAETERNLLKNNEGSSIDKGTHDWGKVLATLSASEQIEDNSEINLDEEASEYRVVRVETPDGDIIYTEDGGEISGDNLEGIDVSDERLNDGYTDIVAEVEDTDLRVVTGLSGIPDEVRDRAKDLKSRFEAENYEDIGVSDDLDLEDIGEALQAVNNSDLVFGYDSSEEIRAEYIETDQADYLVSTATGGEMFTLKKDDSGLELLAYGPSDWHAAFLEEGIDAVENNSEPTVDIETALETGRINAEMAEQAYRNARGEDEVVDVTAYEGLGDVILDGEDAYSGPVAVKNDRGQV